MKKLIITSGTGFLGKVLIKNLRNKFDEIVVVSRSKQRDYDNIRHVVWDGNTIGSWAGEFTNAHTIINLTGKSVDCRYNEVNKKEILLSRLRATTLIADAIKKAGHTPNLWINASSATIYNASFNKPQTEKENDTGDDFSMNVCRQWEKFFFEHDGLAKRMIALRISIVFGNEGGVYPVLRSLVKKGLGGKQGNGKQMVSWIHADDFAQMVQWIINNTTKHKIYNCCSPYPITNKNLMEALRGKHKPMFYINSPEWLLKIGAFFMKTETELILKSRFVVPERAVEEGFLFQYATIKDALNNLN